MVMNILSIEEIVSDPKVRSGRPIIRGTGLCVSDVVAWHLSGDKLSPQQIAEQWQLPIGKIHAALAYYYLNQTQIDDEMRQSADDARRLLAEIKQQGRLITGDDL